MEAGMGLWRHFRVLIALAVCCAAAGSVADSQSAFRKLGAIQTGATPRGSRVSFSRAEIDAWLADEAKAKVPQGLTGVRMELSAGRAVGHATIDFLKIRQAASGAGDPGWLIRTLFAGERPVTVTARFESTNGRARADVERVEISGVPLEGRALDFVIENYVRPTFPDIKVNQWFPLEYGVEGFTVGPQGVVVQMRRR
jgi:hypothetical protein